MNTKNLPTPYEHIARRILLIRGHKVMLDAELAELYGVSTKALNQAVKRNIRRFPEDFMFRLDTDEVDVLNRSQVVNASQKHRDPRQGEGKARLVAQNHLRRTRGRNGQGRPESRRARRTHQEAWLQGHGLS